MTAVNEVLLRTLEKRLCYSFNNPAWLLRALTHRSASADNNERLEFLGDSILNFTAAAQLYQLRPEADEGTLSRYRALLVKGDTLAKIANELELMDCLILGEGELKSGGHRRKSILADAVEAIIGAVYLDGDMQAASDLVKRLLATRLADLPAPDELKDPKTRLQERMQKQGLAVPEYELLEVTGKAHEQRFAVRCSIEAQGNTTDGVGTSRRRAEQDAAAKMLKQLA